MNKITKLKSRKKKEGANAGRYNSSICPNCLSKLVINGLGLQECSGNTLATWENDFIVYTKLNNEQKIAFLKTISDIDKFEELYMRWNYIDSNGFRSNFQCGYSNKLHPVGIKYKTTMLDPVVVKRIEKSLNRKLTEQEMLGEEPIFKKNGVFFTDYKKGRSKVILPVIYFPDDC